MVAVALIASTAIGGFMLAGCKGGPRFGHVFNMSKSDEIKLGQQSAQDVDSKSRFITSGPEYDRLQRVAARILPLAKRDYDVPFQVRLIDSKDVNAFALPGGPIYFYRGLMDLTTSDDEVASVLGHEATHIVKRHSVQQISDAQTKGLAASILLGKSSNGVQQVAGGLLQIDQLSFSRDDEAQADEFGFKYLTEAGYNPDAMASMFRKLQAQEGKGGGGQEFLQNHPLTRKRIQKAEERATDYKREHPTAP